jgi:hypothetical protein
MSSRRHQIRAATALRDALDGNVRQGSLAELARLILDGKIERRPLDPATIEGYLEYALEGNLVRSLLASFRDRTGSRALAGAKEPDP